MVVDASVWAGFFIEDDSHYEASRRWLRQQFGEYERLIFGPTLVLAEVAGAVVRRTGNSVMASAFVAEMVDLPELELVSLDKKLGLTASRLAADLRLRGADACYVAVAQSLGLPLVTWDEELRSRAQAVVTTLEPG